MTYCKSLMLMPSSPTSPDSAPSTSHWPVVSYSIVIKSSTPSQHCGLYCCNTLGSSSSPVKRHTAPSSPQKPEVVVQLGGVSTAEIEPAGCLPLISHRTRPWDTASVITLTPLSSWQGDRRQHAGSVSRHRGGAGVMHEPEV